MDEAQALQQIAAGNTQAFGVWLAAAEAPLRRSLSPFAAFVDTEVVLQEAALRVWQVAPKFVSDGKPEALLRFAKVTARNLAYDELRRTKPVALADEVLRGALEPSVEPAPPDPLLRKVIALCRSKLPPQPAAALLARLASDGNAHDLQLATALKMSLNTFLQNFTRARKLLLACLKANGVEL